VIQKLKKGEIQFLVATDIAARGIDISGLTHVINYEFPSSIEVYIHRVGRTGRVGKEGTALSIVRGEDLQHLVQLKHLHKIFFDIRELPPMKEVIQLAANNHIEKFFKESLNYVVEPYLPLADAIQNDPRGRFILAHLLKMYYEGHIQAIQPALQKAKEILDEESVFQKIEEKPLVKVKSIAKEKTQAKESIEINNSDETVKIENNQERSENPSKEDARVYINVGTDAGFQSDSLRQMVAEESNIGPRDLGAIQIERSYSFLSVSAEHAEIIIATFQGREVNNLTINAEIARKRRSKRRRR